MILANRRLSATIYATAALGLLGCSSDSGGPVVAGQELRLCQPDSIEEAALALEGEVGQLSDGDKAILATFIALLEWQYATGEQSPYLTEFTAASATIIGQLSAFQCDDGESPDATIEAFATVAASPDVAASAAYLSGRRAAPGDPPAICSVECVELNRESWDWLEDEIVSLSYGMFFDKLGEGGRVLSETAGALKNGKPIEALINQGFAAGETINDWRVDQPAAEYIMLEAVSKTALGLLDIAGKVNPLASAVAAIGPVAIKAAFTFAAQEKNTKLCFNVQAERGCFDDALEAFENLECEDETGRPVACTSHAACQLVDPCPDDCEGDFTCTPKGDECEWEHIGCRDEFPDQLCHKGKTRRIPWPDGDGCNMVHVGREQHFHTFETCLGQDAGYQQWSDPKFVKGSAFLNRREWQTVTIESEWLDCGTGDISLHYTYEDYECGNGSLLSWPIMRHAPNNEIWDPHCTFSGCDKESICESSHTGVADTASNDHCWVCSQ